jgi:MFS family permease
MTTAGSTREFAVLEDTSLAGFYRDMNIAERRTFWACAAGWGLDGMDFMIYPLVIATITAQWGVDRGTAGLAVTSALLTAAAGGWLAGYFADRIGRLRMLQITILWFSSFSLICAFVQDFNQLLIARAGLGFGFGGEWGAGAVLMGEVIRAEYRGRAVGCVQSAWAVGWGAAVLGQAVLFSLLPPDLAWRWLFGLGALPALLVFYLRYFVEEPAIARTARALQTADGDRPVIWEIFHPRILRTTVLAAIFGVGVQGGYYAVMTWLPTFLKDERKISVVGSTGYLAVLIVGSFAGYLAGAWIADRFGRRVLFLSFAIGAMATVLVYTQAPLSDSLLWLLGFPLGFFASGYISGVGAFFTELFPTRIRGSAQGFCYNAGRAIAALFPPLVGFLSESMTLAAAIAIFAVGAYALLFAGALLLPETRGRKLSATDSPLVAT